MAQSISAAVRPLGADRIALVLEACGQRKRGRRVENLRSLGFRPNVRTCLAAPASQEWQRHQTADESREPGQPKAREAALNGEPLNRQPRQHNR